MANKNAIFCSKVHNSIGPFLPASQLVMQVTFSNPNYIIKPLLLHPRTGLSQCFCFLHFVQKSKNSLIGVIFLSNLNNKPTSNSKNSNSCVFFHRKLVLNLVMRIRDILVRIRILQSVSLTNGSGCGSGRLKTYRSYGFASATLVFISTKMMIKSTSLTIDCFLANIPGALNLFPL
jgi:hypothetical protein